MTRFWCAYWTAAQTCRKIASRADVSRPRDSQSVHELAAVHVLHDEVRKAVARRAAVEQPRDVRMRQAGEDLPLVAEARRMTSVSIPRLTILIATCCSNASSARTAR